MSEPIILHPDQELPVERVTIYTTHSPDWVVCRDSWYYARADYALTTIADMETDHCIFTALTRDAEGNVCIMEDAQTSSALYRVRMPVPVAIDARCAPLTKDAVRVLAPGTVMYCRRRRRLVMRVGFCESPADDEVYVREFTNYSNPWKWGRFGAFDVMNGHRLDLVVCYAAADETPYVLK